MAAYTRMHNVIIHSAHLLDWKFVLRREEMFLNRKADLDICLFLSDITDVTITQTAMWNYNLHIVLWCCGCHNSLLHNQAGQEEGDLGLCHLLLSCPVLPSSVPTWCWAGKSSAHSSGLRMGYPAQHWTGLLPGTGLESPMHSRPGLCIFIGSPVQHWAGLLPGAAQFLGPSQVITLTESWPRNPGITWITGWYGNPMCCCRCVALQFILWQG